MAPLNLGKTKRAMEWSGFLAAALADTLDSYRGLLGDIDNGKLDDSDEDYAFELATSAAIMLRDLDGHLDEMLDVLPPALQPGRAMQMLQSLAESSLAMIALGPDHELVLGEAELDRLLDDRSPRTDDPVDRRPAGQGRARRDPSAARVPPRRRRGDR